jgi:hypothetical protein
MTHVILEVTITYPTTPAEYKSFFGGSDFGDKALLLLATFTSAHESGARVEFFDEHLNPIGNLRDIINNIRTATWPERFKETCQIVMYDSVFAFLIKTRTETELESYDQVMSVAMHLAWMAHGAAITRTTRADGYVDEIYMSELQT